VPPAQADQFADGDDTPGDEAPGDGHDGDGVGRGGGSGGNGHGGDGRGGDGDGRGADLSQMPGFDRASCTRGLAYPWRAAMRDKESVVRMRVSLDAAGRVHQATVLQRVGYGFDEKATEAVMRRCRFTAALDRDGKPTAFVIDDFRFYFRFRDFEQVR